MHESHLITPLVKGIDEHARKEGATKVTRVRLKVGILTGAGETSFKETFRVLSKDTILENAELEVTFFPGSHVEVLSFDVE